VTARALADATVPAPDRAASRAVFGFVLRFVGGWAVVLALVAWVPSLERWAVDHTISSLGATAGLFHLSFQGSDAMIQLGDVSMQIVPDCTPLMPTAAFAIAVLAFPAPWTWRLIGLATGVLLLWGYNLARIFALVPVLRHRPEWFDFIHVYLWQTMTLLVVFAMFMGWLGLQQRRGAPLARSGANDPPAAPARPAADSPGGEPPPR